MPQATVALLQTDPGQHAAANLDQALAIVAEATRAGADWVCLPKTFHCRGRHVAKVAASDPVPGPLTAVLADAVRAHGIWLFAGSFDERSNERAKTRNASTVFGPDGRLAAVYRKLHLFDVAVGEGARLLESARVSPGDRIVAVDPPLGPVSQTICYDLRFPELQSGLALRAAVATMAPSNYTVLTGRDHWEPLLRARAIENGGYLIAPVTIGNAGGEGGFVPYDRSMVVDPWGTVIACAPDEMGITFAQIDT